MRAIYALRFLIEAYRSRSDSLRGFQNELAARIISVLIHSKDIMACKISAEGIGILSTEGVDSSLAAALAVDNAWVSEAAFGACRYLPSISANSERRLFGQLTRYPPRWVLFPNRDFLYTLKVADVFRSVKVSFQAFRADSYLRLLGGVLCVLIMEFLLPGSGLLAFLVAISGVAIALSFKGRWFSFALRSFMGLEDGIRFSSWNYVDLVLCSIQTLPVMIFILPPTLFRYLTESEAKQSISAYLSLLILTLSFPLASLFLSLKRGDASGLHRRIFTRRVITFISRFILAVAAVLSVLIALIIFAKEETEWVFNWIGFIFWPFVVVSIVFSAAFESYPRLRDWWLDRRNLVELTAKFTPSRIAIANAFLLLKTKRARCSYVEWLDHVSAGQGDRSKLSDIRGNPWPSEGRPNIANDVSSTLLAQLDARWLGLDA